MINARGPRQPRKASSPGRQAAQEGERFHSDCFLLASARLPFGARLLALLAFLHCLPSCAAFLPGLLACCLHLLRPLRSSSLDLHLPRPAERSSMAPSIPRSLAQSARQLPRRCGQGVAVRGGGGQARAGTNLMNRNGGSVFGAMGKPGPSSPRRRPEATQASGSSDRVVSAARVRFPASSGSPARAWCARARSQCFKR